MTILGRGLYIAEAQSPPITVNAAPSIAPVLLNFDLVSNNAPVGNNQNLIFDVTPFTAPNSGPIGMAQTLEFNITSPI